MFVPLSDDNPLRRIQLQWVTIALIAINAIAFAWQLSSRGGLNTFCYALIPAELFQMRVFGGAAAGPHGCAYVPEAATLITSTFLHADFWHLFGNMVFLWVFGDNVEDALGHVKYLAFYLACGIIAGLTHAIVLPGSKIPLIGASGAVAGVIAAYLMLHPHVKVWILALRVIPLNITAMWALGAWVLTQFGMLAMQFVGMDVGPVAWWAHIGGILAGAALVIVMREPGVPLFDRPGSSV